MNVTLNGNVQFVHRGLIELDPRLFFDPGLELWISGARIGDEFLDGVRVQPKGTANHRIITFADARIAGGEFAARFEGNLLPHSGQVHDAERTRHAGTDERNNASHSFIDLG